MATKSKNDPAAVDVYLATLPRAEQEALESLRRLIKETVPQVEERISYGTTVMFRWDTTWSVLYRRKSISRFLPPARRWRQR